MNSQTRPELPADLSATRARLRSGDTSAAAQIDDCIAAASSPRCDKAFLHTMFAQARQTAADPLSQRRTLAGLAVSVKDLFDIQGQVTAAGSRALTGNPQATQDCPAVARLRAAGGALIGRTNMVEFAFSGVGTNPHYGTPANAASLDEALIPGGSSSGAAVSVAVGAAFIGLGSDTGGSIRIPAALNGIVGFKSTARLVPAQGAIPLSTTLDTVSALTRSVSDAILAHEILSACVVPRSATPLPRYRLAVVSTMMHEGLDTTVSRAYQRALDRLRASGARITEITLPEFDQIPSLMAHGGFSGAESFAWHRTLLAQHAAEYDPRVAARIGRGAAMGAADYVELLAERRAWIARVEQRLRGFDAVLSPTVPIVAPPIALVAPGAARDEAFFLVNAQLLRNTSAVNLLDGCAISIPCHARGELPVGLMIWHGAMRDDTVLHLALRIEQLLGGA